MDRQATMRHDLPHPLQHLPPALLSHANQRLGLRTELRCRRGQQVEYAIVGRLDDVQDGDLRRCWYVQRSEQSCGCQGVLGFVHRQKDPQASCTLPGRSSPSSAADQDRARCRIEHALARLNIPARIIHAPHPSAVETRAPRTDSRAGLRPVERQGPGEGSCQAETWQYSPA
jgi:hypothetical protein